MSDAIRDANPFVGPLPLSRGDPIFGRDREVAELLQILFTRRIVLLHAPSGAGKTSLVQAGLIPKLEEDGFQILPTVRLSYLPEDASLLGTGVNRYLYSFLSCMAQEGSLDVEELADPSSGDHSLDHYLKRRLSRAQEGPAVVILDQFEEVIKDPFDRLEKDAFFQQLGAALRNRELWALFVIRDDYVGALMDSRYVRPIPTHLVNSYHLSLLGEKEAREAVRETAALGGREFEKEAISELVDNLRRIQVQQPDGSFEEADGPFVEPVQLQIVCKKLWQDLPVDVETVSKEDLRVLKQELFDAESGDYVDWALAGYYASNVRQIAVDKGIDEREIRQWIQERLIIRGRVRIPVMQEPHATKGLDNKAIDALVDAYVLRKETRAGKTWYELTHDRLVQPVSSDNERWFDENLRLLQRQAELWREKRPNYLLLRGETLQKEAEWAETHAGELNENDRAFLDASLEEQKRLDALEQQALDSARADEAEARLIAEEKLAAEAALRAEEAEEAAKQLRRRRNLILGMAAGALAFAGLAIILLLTTIYNLRQARELGLEVTVGALVARSISQTAAAEDVPVAPGAITVADDPETIAESTAGAAVAATAAVMQSELLEAEANATVRPGENSEATLMAVGGMATAHAAAATSAYGATAVAAQRATPTATATVVQVGPTLESTEQDIVTASSPLLFVSDRDGNDAIYVMRNSGIEAVASPLGYAWWPAWCGDGIVFEAGDSIWQPTQIEIAMVQEGNSEPAFVTSNSLPQGSAMNGSPSCSLDGRYLAFSSRSTDAAGNDFKLGRIDLEAERQMFDLLDDGFSLAGHVGWSPDGNTVAFMHYNAAERRFDIYRMPWDDAAQPENLTASLNASCKYPSWSPANNELIAFTCSSFGSRDWSLYIYDGAARNPAPERLLSALHLGSERYDERQTVRHAVTPSWSPDGRWIAYASDVDGDWDIYAYSLESGQSTNLTEEWSDSDELHPWWTR